MTDLRLQSYEDSLDELDLAGWLDHIAAVHPVRMEMTLDRVRAVAQKMDLLKPAYRTVIVAGTNGKGTTSVFLEQLLLHAGLSVGTTLSPHVERFNERMRFGGEDFDDASICDAFAAVERARGEIGLTYFEFSTLAALWLFREREVDVGILEIGLGGRLDSFNIISADIAVVTSIGLDHEAYLGDNVEAIGREKAGVFRSGQTVLLGADMPASVLEQAQTLHCRMLRSGKDFGFVEATDHWTWWMADQRIRVNHKTRFPLGNCALATAVAAQLVDVSALALDAAVAGAHLPGRFEVGRLNNREVIVDVCHNPLGAEYLAARLGRDYPDTRIIAVCGLLVDKDAAGVFNALRAVVDVWICLSTSGERARSGADLASVFAAQSHSSAIEVVEDLDDALQKAGSLAGPSDVILCFGSFTVVERVRPRVIHQQNMSDSA
ncbi:MAG: bifunctional tetrahydrofolate synthase/dihydrofolate synthase [Proteobacteria bacterium]|nr:bifunctional tetrahydrofolate synthase/dihydrofolate synthase [Pseudomonadota bacterium]